MESPIATNAAVLLVRFKNGLWSISTHESRDKARAVGKSYDGDPNMVFVFICTPEEFYKEKNDG